MNTPKLIVDAFTHVKSYLPEVKILIITREGQWCFMDDDFDAPAFPDEIDTNLLDLAVNLASKQFGLPYIYQHFSVRCNQCGWEGDEDDLETFTDLSDKVVGHDIDYLRGCPHCETDEYLMDI